MEEEKMCWNLALHHLLTNRYSAVNGCRQNESSNSWQKHHKNPHVSGPLFKVLWDEKHVCNKCIKTFLTSNSCSQLKYECVSRLNQERIVHRSSTIYKLKHSRTVVNNYVGEFWCEKTWEWTFLLKEALLWIMELCFGSDSLKLKYLNDGFDDKLAAFHFTIHLLSLTSHVTASWSNRSIRFHKKTSSNANIYSQRDSCLDIHLLMLLGHIFRITVTFLSAPIHCRGSIG